MVELFLNMSWSCNILNAVVTEGCYHSEDQRSLPMPNWLMEDCATTHAHTSAHRGLQPTQTVCITAVLTGPKKKGKK